MKALITGASGFVGRHLAWRLVNMGDTARCLVRQKSDRSYLEPLGAEFCVGDITDPASLKAAVDGVDVVYHLAGQIRVAASDDLFLVNAVGTKNISDACAALASPPVLVLVSSIAANGPAAAADPLIETDREAPISAYGRSKLAAEEAARANAGRVPTAIARPPLVFGEMDTEMFELFRLVAKGWHLAPRGLTERVSLMHVADLTRLLVGIVDHGERLSPEGPRDQGVYFGGCELDPTWAELAGLLATALDVPKPRIISSPQAVTWGVAAIAELAARLRRKPSLFGFDKAKEAHAGAWYCSSEKGRVELKLKTRMTLPERLRQTAQWYRDEAWL